MQSPDTIFFSAIICLEAAVRKTAIRTSGRANDMFWAHAMAYKRPAAEGEALKINVFHVHLLFGSIMSSRKFLDKVNMTNVCEN